MIMKKAWMMSLLFTLTSAAEQYSLHVGEPSSTLNIDSFTSVRIHIHGLPRRHNLIKYAHSVKVKVKANLCLSNSNTIHVCFHRNISLGIGMCPPTHRDKLIHGFWTHTMSPYDTNLLDITTSASHPSFQMLQVSIEQEFLIYRVLFLGLGILMLAMAPCLSKSITFYYSSTMAVGVILVILIVLFQGMKLLPTGRKNSFAVVIYSSLVGVGSFFLRYLPGLLHSLLVEIGINDDMYVPLVTLLLVTIILAGAWLGFWVVHRLLLNENGSIDSRVALFVLWSIRLFSAVMIIQSSLDPLLATAALVSGILLSSIMRITILRFLHRLHRMVKSKHRKSRMQGSPSKDFNDESPNRRRRSEEDENLRRRTERYTVSPSNIRAIDLTKPSLEHSANSVTYFSTFHDTPERKKFSKEEWEIFTRDSTKKALKELVASPDFSKWAAGNAERLTLTPSKGSSSERQPPRWLPWF